MSPRALKIGMGTAAPILGFSGFALGASRLLNLQGSTRSILYLGLGVLGLTSAVLVFRYLSRALPRKPAEDRPEREIDEIFGEVRDKLKAARVAGGKIRRLPVVLFLGPRGGTKTTLVERGGVDAELVAGEVYRGSDVAPSRNVNVWLSGETLLVEAAGELIEDEARWSRLVHHLRPARMAAVLGRGRQAPRTAVVCFPAAELRRAGRSEPVTETARLLRERLHDLARSLGVRLPVYVLFTKADRIDHFEAFVDRFTAAEAQEVLGVTLPLDRSRSGAYAERESERLSGEFDRLFRSLAGRRPELLQRESESPARGGIYEFPRELLKLRDPAVRFLVELGRPRRLAVSPVLRGFYLTGVRPIVPEEAGGVEPARETSRDAPAGATAVFKPGAQAARPRPRSSGGSGRIPEWAFVRTLFRKILLGDRIAMGLTAGGARVNLLRRTLAGAALLLGAIWVVGLLTSYLNNRRLASDVAASMEAARGVPADDRSLPEADDLRRLATLGAQVDRLRDYEVDGAPLGLRWGLYRGGALLEPARRLYFRLFEQPLAIPARSELVSDLETVSAASGGSGSEAVPYDSIYQDLKAYLIITDRPDSSQVDFLAPVLAGHRLRGFQTDSVYAELALEQFGLYARELRHGNPYDWPVPDSVVPRAREYLATFTSEEQVYRRMVENASSAIPGIEFAGGVVASGHAVRGAFTREGWDYISRGLEENIERLLRGEEWVTGPQDFSESDLRGLREDLWARYEREYVREWQALLRETRIAGFTNVASAARALEALSGNRSPLLELLGEVATQTDVSSDTVRSAFRPVHVVTPPDTTDDEATDLIVDANSGYITALASMASAMDEAADARGDDQIQALQRAQDASRRVNDEVTALRQGFGSGELARPTENDVRRLLDTPAEATRRLVPQVAAGGMRGRLQAFCEEFAPVLSAYPFDSRAAREATIDEIDALFKPREGLLWTFPQDELGDVLLGSAGSYRVQPDASPRPTDPVVDFLNNATRIAEAFYPSGGDGPRISLGLLVETTLPRVIVNIDSRQHEWRPTASARRSFEWVGPDARSALIAGEIDGRMTTLLQEAGSTWALFKLLDNARWAGGGDPRRLSWELPDHNQTLRAELYAGNAIPILDPAERGGLRCVAEVVR